MNTPIALSIAGSDPSAGAGIQADLRMFSAQGVYGTTVITALTAQNPNDVHAVCGMDPAFVQQQLETIHALPIAAIKTGMLWSKEIVNIVGDSCRKHPEIPLVIDPVMISTSGAKLISDSAIIAYKEELFPQCQLLTPNLDEASILLGCTIDDQNLDSVALELYQKFECPILLKGGHSRGTPVDTLYDGNNLYRWKQQRVYNINSHGTGCMLSAAIAAGLAKEEPLYDAVQLGLESVQRALRHPIVLNSSISLAGIEYCQ